MIPLPSGSNSPGVRSWLRAQRFPGGPEFKSRRPDQFMFFVSRHLAIGILESLPLRISPRQEVQFCKLSNSHASLRTGMGKVRGQERQ